jgi:hypothetical protein
MKKLFTIGLLSFSLFAQAQFTAGNLVVMKISSTTPLSGAPVGTSRQASLVEFTRTGTLVKTTDISATGTDKFVIEDRRIAHEGQLMRSDDGKYLTAVGYNNTINQTATAIRADEKVVIRIDAAGKIDYSTRIPTKEAFNGAGVRAAFTVDGSKHFVCSGAPGSAQGTREILHGDTKTTLLSEKQYRAIGYFGGTFFGVTQDAVGAMEAEGVKVDIPEMSGDLTQFVFFDVDPTESWNGTGLDQLYIANRNSGIRKYYYDGVKWVFVSTYNTPLTAVNTGFVAMTGTLEDGKPTLYGIKVAEAETVSYLVRVQDKTTLKVNWNSTGNYPNVQELATAGSTELFRGISFATGPLPTKAATVGTKDLTNELPALMIKPSVTTDQINVVLPNETATKISIVNMQGQYLMNVQGQGETTIDVSALPNGVYFIRSAQGNGRFVKQ